MLFKRTAALLVMAALFACSVSACSDTAPNNGSDTGSEKAEMSGNHIVTVSGDLPGGECTVDLELLSGDSANCFSGAYSVTNNWPTKKLCAGEGVLLSSVLEYAGAMDDFQQITVLSSDGYYMSFTRGQVLADRYCFPGILSGDESGASYAPMILSLSRAENTDDLNAPTESPATLMFGQEDISEHNSPAFVESVSEIIVSSEDPGRWETADTFPSAGNIASGETVKLQHSCSGLVKMYYTTDGSDPTYVSAMYNPSTYQPELNVPITITGDTTVKVLVRGYGKNDSEIATFLFTALGQKNAEEKQ